MIYSLKLTLGGGFKYFLFSSLSGEDFQFDDWWNHQLEQQKHLKMDAWKTRTFPFGALGLLRPIQSTEVFHVFPCRLTVFVLANDPLFCSEKLSFFTSVFCSKPLWGLTVEKLFQLFFKSRFLSPTCFDWMVVSNEEMSFKKNRWFKVTFWSPGPSSRSLNL